MPSSRNLRQSEELSERIRPRSLRLRPTFLVLILSACFVLALSLKESIAIPPAYRNPARAFRATVDDLKTAFVDANSSLSEDALAVQCSGSGRFLKELVVCFSRDGQPTACSTEIQKDAAKSCGNMDFLVRNVK